jgi:hypothetical protein
MIITPTESVVIMTETYETAIPGAEYRHLLGIAIQKNTD